MIDVYESLSVNEDISIVRHLALSVYDAITVSEVFGDGNIFNYESISVAEVVSLYVPPDFGNFLRTYPFVEVTLRKVDIIELGGGYEQMIDWWGRTKKGFNINIAISYLDEILPVRTFYEENYGSTFDFTNPIDNVKYRVRFVDNAFPIQRIAFNTYVSSLQLVEWI